MGSVWGPSRGLPMVQFVFFGLICDARDLFVLISVIGFIRKGANYKFTTAYKLKLHRRLRNSFGALRVKQICFKCPVHFCDKTLKKWPKTRLTQVIHFFLHCNSSSSLNCSSLFHCHRSIHCFCSVCSATSDEATQTSFIVHMHHE